MKALVLHPPGGPEDLTYAEVRSPLPATGDVLVCVHAAGFTPGELSWPSNWVDRSGHKRAPSIPAREFAGEVVALGYGSAGFRVGDRVFGLADSYRDGAAAELVAVETRSITLIPPDLSFLQAAALPQAGLAAWQALFAIGQALPGTNVLVLGASGAVGTMAIQLAQHSGLWVTAGGSGDGASFACALGARDYLDLDKALPQGAGQFELILDTIGHKAVVRVLPLLAPSGTVVSVVEPPPDDIDGEGHFFVLEADRAHLELIADRAQVGHLRAPIGAVYPLSDGRQAFIDKAHRKVRGKGLLVPADKSLS
jgi:NADPH:quinone reductase-like Zn-dependent oxidoreductase